MRVLVTGAGGFLGGHVARRLAETGFEVIATTRASPIEPPESTAAARRFHTLTVDLARGALLPPTDAVVHTAGTSAWTDISVDQMLTDNVVATRALVRHALTAKGVSLCVFFLNRAIFSRTQPAHLEHEKAKTELKTLVPDDAQQAIGHGVRAKRSKSGAITFELLKAEDDHATVE